MAAVVSTVAGNLTAGHVDGQVTAARFFKPQQVVVDSTGNLYVGDAGNYCIRMISTTSK